MYFEVQNSNQGSFSDFPTAPDRDEILVDGTVFYAESNMVCFFSKNEK